MRRRRSWTLAVVFLLSVLIIMNFPFSSALDETVDKEKRVSDIESIGISRNESMIYDRPFNRVISPVIDRNNDLHYLVLTYTHHDQVVEMRLNHTIKHHRGDFENHSVDVWNVTDAEIQSSQWDAYKPRLILSPSGTPHAIYIVGRFDGAGASRCAQFVDGAWSHQRLGTSVGQLVDGSNVVADDLGRIHLLYCDTEPDPSTGTRPLKYMNNIGGDWNRYTIGSVNWNFGGISNMDIDAQGNIVVFYGDQELNLVQASYDNGVWRSSVLVERADDPSEYPVKNIVYARMDLDGNRHIFTYVYESGSNPDDCIYMSDATGTWTNVSVPSSVQDELTSGTISLRNGAIVRSDGRLLELSPGRYEIWIQYRIYRFDGRIWEVVDLDNQLYYTALSGHLIIGPDGSFNVVSDQYRVTYSDEWPQNTALSPTELVAIPGDRTVTLAWEGAEEQDLLCYRIYRKNPSSTTYTVIADTLNTTFTDGWPESGDDLYESDLGMLNGQEYTYAVTALTTDGESSPSNFVKVMPCTAPGPPENLFAFDDGNSVALIWSHPSNDGGSAVTGYNVTCEDEDGAFLWNRSLGNVTVLDTDTFVPGERYIFRVTAINAAGTGGRTAMEFITPEEVGEPYYVLSQSSSTSNVRFDNESRSITFAVSGSDGSLGLSFVVIPKDLVDNSSDMRATLDGSELPITVQETDTAYVITMTYHHSTHEVVVYWGEDRESSYLLLVTIGLVAVVSTIGLIILIRRRKKV